MSETSSLLIIRFSSFGDIVQATAAASDFAVAYPNSKIDWLCRADFGPFLTRLTKLDRHGQERSLFRDVIAFAPKSGSLGLIALAWTLGARRYDYVYDAHCNLRSQIFRSSFSSGADFSMWLASDQNRASPGGQKTESSVGFFFASELRFFRLRFGEPSRFALRSRGGASSKDCL